MTNITAPRGLVNSRKDLTQAYIFDTVADYQASTIEFPVGKIIHLKDRGADFEVVAYNAGANGFNEVENSAGDGRIELVMDSYTTAAQFGVNPNGANTESANLAYITAVNSVNYTDGTYTIDRLPNLGTRTYTGMGSVTINFEGSGDPLCKLSGNSSYKNLNFTSLIPTKDSQRGAIDDTSDVYVEDCNFSNFIDTGVGNAWGVLIQRSSRITLNRCSFSNNTQADIALTDSCFDITVINPKNTVDEGTLLNVEPNGKIGTRGMNVIGGHYREVTLLENAAGSYASKNIVVQGAEIESLTYDGSGVDFRGCTIKEIKPEGQDRVISFAGSFRCNTIELEQNLISDSYLFDVSFGDSSTFWLSSGTASPLQKRVNDPVEGKFNRLNPEKDNLQVIVATRDFIPISPDESFLTFLRARVDNSGTGDISVDVLQVIWYDSSFNEIKRTVVKCCRGDTDEFVDWKNDVATVTSPPLAAHMKVRVSNHFTNNRAASVDIARIGIFRYDLLSAGDSGNLNNVFDEMSSPVTKSDYTRSSAFLTDQRGYGGCFVGERVILNPPTVGQPKAWSCTSLPASAGFSGTLTSEGDL